MSNTLAFSATEPEKIMVEARQAMAPLQTNISALPAELKAVKIAADVAGIKRLHAHEKELHGQLLEISADFKKQIQGWFDRFRPVGAESLRQAEDALENAKTELKRLEEEYQKAIEAQKQRLDEAQKFRNLVDSESQAVRRTVHAAFKELDDQIGISAEFV